MTKKLILLLLLLAPAVRAEKVLYETGWIRAEEMSAILQKMNKNNLFPCRVEGRVTSSEKLYKASYCVFFPRLDYFYSRWGLSDVDYERYTAFYAEKKMTPYVHTTFIDEEGITRHQATWILSKD